MDQSSSIPSIVVTSPLQEFANQTVKFAGEAAVAAGDAAVAMGQVAGAAIETATSETVAEGSSWYAGRLVETYGPGLLTEAVIYGAKGFIGYGIVGSVAATALGLGLAPVVVPAATVLIATGAVEGTRYILNTAHAYAQSYNQTENSDIENQLAAVAKKEEPKKQEQKKEEVKKEEPKSLATQYGENLGKTYAPPLISRVAIYATEALAVSAGLPPIVGTVAGTAIVAPFVTPYLTTHAAFVAGKIVDAGVKSTVSEDKPKKAAAK
jgi:hypothetical protein